MARERRRGLTAMLLALALAATLSTFDRAGAASGEPLTPELRAWADEHGPLRVGWIALPPVSIVTDGQITGGWAVDAVDLLAIEVGIDVEPVLFPDIPSMVAALAAGEIDVIGLSGQRPDLLGFAAPIAPLSWTPTLLVAGPSTQATTLDELAGGTVTTIPGSPLEAQLLELFPALEPVAADSVPAGVAAVVAGDVDAYYGPLAVIGYQLQRLGARDLRPIGEPAAIVETGSWALPDSEAHAILTAARKRVSYDELAVIHVRWTGFDLTLEAPRGLPVWAQRVLASALGLVVVLGIFALVLRRRVASATAELREHQVQLEALVAERTAELAQANADLAASNEALRSFATSAAHDLRSPLAATAGLAEALRSGVLPAEQQDDILERIGAASLRAADLVQDMLQAADSPNEAGLPVDTALIEAWLHELFDPQLGAAAGRLEVHREVDEVRLPVALVQRLLANLVGNALKHAGSQPRVDVTIGRDDRGWRIVVEDDGDGITADLAARVFERGFQADATSAGIGMGLWSCRVLAQRHGGDLELEPSPSGARFVARLPVTAGAPARSATGDPAPAPVAS